MCPRPRNTRLALGVALLGAVAAVARGAGTPGVVEPRCHMCLESVKFGEIMYNSFAGKKSFQRESWDWDNVLGQGPLPGHNVSFPDMSISTLHMPTEVVDFKMARVEEVKAAVLKRTKVFQEIKDVMAQQQELYHNYNLNFDNSILFVPQWIEFFKDNQKTVMEKFPRAISVAANVFHVPKGAVPFGVHNSEHASTAILRPSFKYWERLHDREGNQHISFHTAVEDQPTVEDEPLIMYENTAAQVSNIGYMLRQMNNWNQVDRKRVDEALSAINSGDISIQQSASNYITCQYLQFKYCPISDSRGDGFWWPLKAGQALFFDNFRFHGAATLGPARKDRFTLDMRVTSYQLNSCNSSVYYHQNPLVSNSFRKSKDCISKIFGYSGYHHLLTVMFNEEIATACADTPMFYFAVNPRNLDEGYVDEHLYFTPKAIENHVKFASNYFQNDNFKMPQLAKDCIAEVGDEIAKIN